MQHGSLIFVTMHAYTNLTPHFIIFEISRVFNNDFQADCSNLFRFLIDFLFQSYEEFCVL